MLPALMTAIAVFGGLAVLVLRWAAADLAGPGTLSAKVLVASWLLYVFHADTVTSAAWIGAVSLGVPRVIALTVGAVLAVGGFAVFVAATLALARHGDFAGGRTRRLVSTGPYSRCRHPQNLGWGVMLIGIAIAGRSVVALAVVGLLVVFVVRYARLEDDLLQRDFGPECDAYRRTTPAMLSGVQQRHGAPATRGR